MTRSEYLCSQLYWLAVLFFIYNTLLFRCIFRTRHAVSVAILVGFALAGTTLGVLFTFRTQRNRFSTVCNMALAYGPYFLITHWAPAHKPLTVAAQLTATAIVCWLFFLIIDYACRRKAGTTRASVRRLVAACVRAIIRIPLLALVAVMTFTVLKTALHLPMLTPSKSTELVTSSTTRRDLILENAEALLQLEESQWNTLTPTQRLDVLALVGSIEAKVLGIPEVDIGASVISDTLWAHYAPGAETITISLADLSQMTAPRAVQTLCHEYHHAYQYNLISLYDSLDPNLQALALFDDTRQYKYEFDHYVDATYDDDEYDEYSSQLCETHSDRYAESAVDEYIYHLYQYATEHNYTPATTSE